MQKIGQHREILTYKNGTAWKKKKKKGFNASVKDRVIYHSIVFIILTIILSLTLYRVRQSNKARTLM